MPEHSLEADWPAPANVHTLVSTRMGGVSLGDFTGFNLADHVQDMPGHVEENRRRLQARLGKDVRVQWIRQVHGGAVHVVERGSGRTAPQADAIYTRESKTACAVLTADCLPVLLCNLGGTEIGVAHAGWRGLLQGVLENTLACFQSPPEDIVAWMGPAIGSCHYEVGPEVREEFLRQRAPSSPADVETAFTSSVNSGKWMADLYKLATQRLKSFGVTRIHGGGHCTWCEADRFYSYRRDPRTGRFVSLIYLGNL